MSEMVERVRQAICDVQGVCSVEPARAAMKALREPTDYMAQEGGTFRCLRDDPVGATMIWQAMIDAALDD